MSKIVFLSYLFTNKSKINRKQVSHFNFRMKLLIVLTFCIGFVVCRNTTPSAPFESGSAHSPPLESTHSPTIHGSGLEIPLSEYTISKNSEEKPKESTGYNNFVN